MSKLYGYGIVFGLILGAGLYVWWLNDRFDTVTKQRDAANQVAEGLNDVLLAERINLAEARERADQYQAERDKSNEANKAMRDCIANKSCGVRVNVVYRTVRDPNTGACGTIEADAESQRELEQNYLSLDAELSLMEDNYAALQRELVVRSAPDYCKAKKSPDV